MYYTIQKQRPVIQMNCEFNGVKHVSERRTLALSKMI